VTVGVCTRCGSVRRGEAWTDLGGRSYAEVAVEAVGDALGVHRAAEDVSWGADVEEVERNALRVHVALEGVVRGDRVEAETTVPVRLGRRTCERCGRIAGGDFDATVQVRADGRDLTGDERETAVETAREYVAGRIDSGDRNAFVTDVEETGGGVDLKLSTTQLGRAVADRIADGGGGTVDRSRRLVTEADGQPVYRMAFAVRLPRFRAGDVIRADGPPVVVDAAGVESVRGRRLDTGAETRIDVDAAERLGRIEDADETTLVAVEDANAVQVLDPETYAATTVRRPSYLDPDAETVSVFDARDGLYVVPGDGGAREG
jgi:nonsense-mediated mRNA decay protein 3